jgi:signal transduction histidine kinase
MRHDAHYVDQLTSRTIGPQVRLIPIGDIDVARPGEARDLAALVKSIQKFGVLQPLLVRPRAGRFELIAGARRLAAAAAAALTEVPCMVHLVDDLKAHALAEAENLRSGEESQAPAVPLALAPSTAPENLSQPAAGLQELGQSLGAVGSCLHLLAERDTALRDRVALDLVRTEVHRAGRLVQGLRLLAQDPALSETGVSLVSAFDQVAEGFLPERRLSGVSMTIEPADGAHRVHADPEWLAAGLSGALGGMLALVQTARSASLTVKISSSASGSSVVLQIEQSGVTVPAWAIGRFFDTEWTDRPGGFQAAVELAAARRVAELHHGGLEIVAGDRSGCKLVLVLPAA